ncbi:MAG: DUF1343 domain-containing protein [Candidatus Rokubacteria bacterium]|nr:DUF1343 domain-containing protein [Candidatus Rokubacteria bacterium]
MRAVPPIDWLAVAPVAALGVVNTLSMRVFARPRRGPHLFDQVWGTTDVRLALQRGDPGAAIAGRWQPGLDRFRAVRERYLLYR